MRKIFSGLMILTLVVLFVATYLCSQKTEEVFKAQVDELNSYYGGILQVELLDYRRGLLVSEVKTRLSLSQQVLPLQHQIRHFPWKVRVLTQVAAYSESVDMLALEQLKLQTDVSLKGDSQSRLVLPELNFSDGKLNLQLQGLRFGCRLDGHLSEGQIDVQLGGLTFAEPGGAQFVLGGVSLQSKFVDMQGLPLGGGVVQVERFAWQADGQADFELKDLRYTADSRLEQEMYASGFDLQLGALKLGGETFTDGQLQLQVAGLDGATIRQVQASARQLQAELIGQQVDPLILQLQLLGLYSQLLEKGLTFSLSHLELRTTDGLLQGNGRLALQGFDLSGGNLAAFEQLSARFQLDLDQPVFAAGFRAWDFFQHPESKRNAAVQDELAGQLAGGLVQKGILVRKDGGYRLDFSVDRGEAKLNGKRFRF